MNTFKLASTQLKSLPSLNSSLMQNLSVSICGDGTSKGQIRENVGLIDKVVCKLMEGAKNELVSSQKELYNWLNIVFFNSAAFAEQNISSIENGQLESTQDAPHSSNRANKGQKELIEEVRSKMQVCLKGVLVEGQFISLLASKVRSRPNILAKSAQLRSLLETFAYLSSKYKIKSPHLEEVSQILQKYSNNDSFYQLQKINELNRFLFSQGQQFNTTLQTLQNNQTISLQTLAFYINTNYYNTSHPRKMFKTANISGRRFIEELIDYIVRNVNKAELFSQKMEDYGAYQVLSQIVLQREAYLFVEFNSKITNQVKSENYFEHFAILEKMAIFIQQIPIKYPIYHHFCHYTYTTLLHKYSKLDSIELMKKFIFNRFLLNPNFYYLISEKDCPSIQIYVRNANMIRICFYDKKIQTIALKQKNNFIKTISNSLIKQFNQFITQQPTKIKLPSFKDRGVYINDKILEGLALNIAGDFLKNDKTVRSTKRDEVNFSKNESSLSFSLRNQSMSRNNISVQNDSKRSYQTILKNLSQKEGKSHQEIMPSKEHLPPRQISKREKQTISQFQPKTQTKKKQKEVTHSDQFILEELLLLRRQYGDQRRIIDSSISQKKAYRLKNLNWLNIVNSQLKSQRKQIDKLMSMVRINTLFI